MMLKFTSKIDFTRFLKIITSHFSNISNIAQKRSLLQFYPVSTTTIGRYRKHDKA